jgi:hypothetical protein
MVCCDVMSTLVDRDMVRVGPVHMIRDGRFITEIDTEYFLVFGDPERPSYAGVNYCPFCGRTLSRELWNREKKK